MFAVANADLCSATKKIPFFKPVCERVIGAPAELFYSGLQLCSDFPLLTLPSIRKQQTESYQMGRSNCEKIHNL